MKIQKKYFIRSIALSVVFFCWNIISSLLLYKYLGVSLGKQISERYSITVEFILVVIIAPIIETILFQYLLITQVYISYNGKNKKTIAILLSAFCFAIIHSYSLYYFLVTLFGGIFLAYFFCSFKDNTNTISAILYLTLIHSLTNLYIFLIKTLNLL